jgi:hypothetical protein
VRHPGGLLPGLQRIAGHPIQIRGLTLNEQKSRVCNGRREAFTFLGNTLGPMRYRKDGHWYLGAAPAKKAVQRIKGRIRQILYTAIIEKEGDVFAALCPELDVASQGATVEEATPT